MSQSRCVIFDCLCVSGTLCGIESVSGLVFPVRYQEAELGSVVLERNAHLVSCVSVSVCQCDVCQRVTCDVCSMTSAPRGAFTSPGRSPGRRRRCTLGRGAPPWRPRNRTTAILLEASTRSLSCSIPGRVERASLTSLLGTLCQNRPLSR